MMKMVVLLSLGVRDRVVAQVRVAGARRMIPKNIRICSLDGTLKREMHASRRDCKEMVGPFLPDGSGTEV